MAQVSEVSVNEFPLVAPNFPPDTGCQLRLLLRCWRVVSCGGGGRVSIY